MDYNHEINNFILENYGKMTYQEMADKLNRMYNSSLTKSSVKMRYHRNKLREKPLITRGSEYDRYLPNGEKELLKVIYLTEEQKQSPEKVLKELGYNPKNWEMRDLIINTWQQNSNEKGITDLYQVKVRLKPLVANLTIDDVISATKEILAVGIKPLPIKKQEVNNDLDNNMLLEFPAVELHLGKMAHHWDTGEDYDHKIAQERFREIISSTVDIQDIYKCGTCFLSIGQDFFNSDTVDNTTTQGTPMQNDLRWKKLFKVGMELYIEAIETLKPMFNKIDIQLCQGNHDVMASFYLYAALEQCFKNDELVKFNNNYRTTQAYSFGDCVIFTNHGDKNYKRLVESIPIEFPLEWANGRYRELHLGHLHSEHVEEKSGLVTRRVGSPSGTDDWHYQNRFIGAIQKHQLFVWHKEKGLQNIMYINFDNKKKLQKVLSKK